MREIKAERKNINMGQKKSDQVIKIECRTIFSIPFEYYYVGMIYAPKGRGEVMGDSSRDNVYKSWRSNVKKFISLKHWQIVAIFLMLYDVGVVNLAYFMGLCRDIR